MMNDTEKFEAAVVKKFAYTSLFMSRNLYFYF